jgi:hypothetical protein
MEFGVGQHGFGEMAVRNKNSASGTMLRWLGEENNAPIALGSEQQREERTGQPRSRYNRVKETSAKLF